MRLDLVDRQYGPAIRACASNLRDLDLGSRRAGMKVIDPNHSYAQTVSTAKKRQRKCLGKGSSLVRGTSHAHGVPLHD